MVLVIMSRTQSPVCYSCAWDVKLAGGNILAQFMCADTDHQKCPQLLKPT